MMAMSYSCAERSAHCLGSFRPNLEPCEEPYATCCVLLNHGTDQKTAAWHGNWLTSSVIVSSWKGVQEHGACARMQHSR